MGVFFSYYFRKVKLFEWKIYEQKVFFLFRFIKMITKLNLVWWKIAFSELLQVIIELDQICKTSLFIYFIAKRLLLLYLHGAICKRQWRLVPSSTPLTIFRHIWPWLINQEKEKKKRSVQKNWSNWRQEFRIKISTTHVNFPEIHFCLLRSNQCSIKLLIASCKNKLNRLHSSSWKCQPTASSPTLATP